MQHYPAARDALERGLDVICDKPLTTRLEDALDLVRRVRASGLVFCLTTQLHRLSDGAPCPGHGAEAARSARSASCTSNTSRAISPRATDADRDPAANWRFAPEQCGPSLVLGDIGTHAHHLACFITGLELAEVAAELGSAVPGRKVHDYAHLLLRFGGGARGSMWVTNSAAGAEHGLHIRVFGDEGGLEWHQEEPNRLLYRPQGGFAQVLTRGRPGLSPEAAARHADRARASRRLSRGVRQSVPRRRRGDRRAADRRRGRIRSRSTSRPWRTAPAG